MAEYKSNEREFQGQVVAWLNESLNTGSYPFSVVSSETSLKTQDKTRFPDVQVWLSREANRGFCGWELKTPATPSDDKELLGNAALKAQAMNADYFVTWNMRDAIIWRTPLRQEEVSQYHRLKTYAVLHQVNTPDDLWVPFKQELLKSRSREILNDLSTLHRDGHLHLVDVDSVFFVHRLSEAVAELKPFMKESLAREVGKNTAFKNGLFGWAVKQGIVSYEAGETFYDTVSRQIVYRLLGKILFYLTLRRFRSDIPKMELHDIHPERISDELKRYFEIARGIDYQAIFEEDFTDGVSFPIGGAETLVALLEDLNRYNFSRMPQDVIGNVFEKLIPHEERHTLGQYFTGENLVDLITAFCVKSKSDNVLDPTCGTGTFLLRAYDRLRNAGERDHKKLLSQIWGMDVAHFPAELATINLYRQNLDDYANFPRIIAKDFFEVKKGDLFKFPPPKVLPGQNFTIDERIPEFDSIIGNFPYIMQELIEKRITGYKQKLVSVLSHGWRKDYPELFNNGDMKLSGQADIYAYLFFHATTHLKEGGRLGIVTSNSWLDVAYGYELQKFFLRHFKIVAIIESRCEPWFEDAAINTVITILERCADEEKRELNNVRFVKIKKRLHELIRWDINSPVNRWHGLDMMINQLEQMGSEFLEIKKNKSVNTLKDHATYDDDNFRVRVLRQKALLDEVIKEDKTVKWGRHLRAPDIYFQLLKVCKDRLVPLSKLADVRRGYTTGINEFFHLDEDKARHWGIEKEFLLPIIKSYKELEKITFDDSFRSSVYLFKCGKEKKKLRFTHALKYIKHGETLINKNDVPYPDAPSVKGRGLWYDTGDREPWDMFVQENWNTRFFVPLNNLHLLADKRLYEIKAKKNPMLLAGLLNSSFAHFMMETVGRKSLGEGALDLTVYEFEELLIPEIEDAEHIKKIEKAFDKLRNRPIESIFEEVKKKDRQALDSAVLEALGLDPKIYLKPLYDGLTEMVRERIDLAKSRKTIKKAKTGKNIEKLKEQIIEEILPHGLKNFPDEFIDSKYLKHAVEIPVPAERLRLGSYFMGKQEICSEGDYRYEAESTEEAKYIIYCQKPDTHIVKIPKDNIALQKAIDEYEAYLKEVKSKLFEALFNRTLDHRQSDTIANQVFDELGIPFIDCLT